MADTAATPENANITYRETIFSIIETLTSKFTGLSPIELLNAPTDQVLSLWVDTIISSQKNGKSVSTGNQAPAEEMVYSYNATWC